MTDILDDQARTQPIAHRQFATTYHASPARMRSDETLVLDSRTGRPYHFPQLRELGHLQEPPTGSPPPIPRPPAPAPRAETLEDMLAEETVPVPPPSAYISDLDEVRKPFLGHGVRRAERDPRWTWALIGAGMTVLMSAAAIGVSALLGVAW